MAHLCPGTGRAPGRTPRRSRPEGRAGARAEPAIAMRRGGEAEEVAAAALYLASDGASYTTGAILKIDGGA